LRGTVGRGRGGERDRHQGDDRRVRDGPAARGGRRRGRELARGQVMDSKALAVMATAVAGSLVAMQAPINSGLGKTIGSLPAASFSFAIGLVALIGITFISGDGFGQL